MNEDPGNLADAESDQHLSPWPECDVFCINSYSGADGPACGWRGRFLDAQHDVTDAKVVCPRCNCATLLRISPERPDKAGA